MPKIENLQEDPNEEVYRFGDACKCFVGVAALAAELFLNFQVPEGDEDSGEVLPAGGVGAPMACIGLRRQTLLIPEG